MIALWTAPQGGAWTRLPGPVTAWSILRTDRLGKDSFRVELADAALPDGRLRFSARVDGVGWFTGLADEVLRTESGAGRRLVLRGRGMDALLEDCEFDAQTGTGITPAALATRVLQPVGLSAWSDAQSATGTLKTALGSTGSSIVQDYCASAGHARPRAGHDGGVWRPHADAHGLRPPRQRGRHYHGAGAGGTLSGASLARGRGGDSQARRITVDHCRLPIKRYAPL